MTSIEYSFLEMKIEVDAREQAGGWRVRRSRLPRGEEGGVREVEARGGLRAGGRSRPAEEKMVPHGSRPRWRRGRRTAVDLPPAEEKMLAHTGSRLGSGDGPVKSGGDGRRIQ
jgi:hypothetical protein